ncbi:LicD family protein [bacterium]|nr:LicD family protein [bacterium]
MDKKINICLSCDNNYAKYAGVVIASILKNAGTDDNLNIYILDGGIGTDNKNKILSLQSIKNCNIQFVEVDKNKFLDFKGITTHSYISLPAYYRLKMPSLLPEIDRIIYFDCDVIVEKSLNDLFNIEMGNHAIAGVPDIKKKMQKTNPTYTNSGILVMDLKNMREQDLESKFFEYAKEHYNEIVCGDQEIINQVCKGEILLIDSKWNVQISNFLNRSDYTKCPYIVHFIGKNKPWQYTSFSYRKDLYYKYLQITPWRLNKKDLFKYRIIGEFIGFFKYIIHRPLFLFRPKFWCAFYHTYIESFIRFIFSIDKNNTQKHSKITLFGIKFKILRKEYLNERKQLSEKYNRYKSIEDIPPAIGSLRLIQKANLTFLKYFDALCKEHNITYWLDFGTLLGAVRHKGFIPWDDDIDIGMLREDYERFIEIFSNECEKHPKFQIAYKNNHKEMCFLKIMSNTSENVCIDVFPYDKYHSELNENEKKELSESIAKFTKLKWYQKFKKFKTVNDICSHFKTVTKEKILKNQQITTDTPAIFMGIDFPHKWNNKVYDWNTIFPLNNIVFENTEFPAPQRPEVVLRSIYGNFMSIPKDSYPKHTTYMSLDEMETKALEDMVK